MSIHESILLGHPRPLGNGKVSIIIAITENLAISHGATAMRMSNRIGVDPNKNAGYHEDSMEVGLNIGTGAIIAAASDANDIVDAIHEYIEKVGVQSTELEASATELGPDVVRGALYLTKDLAKVELIQEKRGRYIYYNHDTNKTNSVPIGGAMSDEVFKYLHTDREGECVLSNELHVKRVHALADSADEEEYEDDLYYP